MNADTCGVNRECSGANRDGGGGVGGDGGTVDGGRDDCNDIYRLFDVLPSRAPEMTQSLHLPPTDTEIDDVTTTVLQRSSCLCSCHTLPRNCHIISHDGGCSADYNEDIVPEVERRSATIDRRYPTAGVASSTLIPGYRRQAMHQVNRDLKVKCRMAASTGELAATQCALWTSSELGNYGNSQLSRGRGEIGFYGLH
jgi:hypothetical protein